MAEPLSEPECDACLARAGLRDLTPAERAGIRAATRHIVAMAERLRTPAPPAPLLEPATVFAPREKP
ncbi:MAG: hypothetical protein NW223_11595 [Hyphomicrobiaceae bacterium]|nr:hypothetical protein [Hyphomicrobiaceae bacterium]